MIATGAYRPDRECPDAIGSPDIKLLAIRHHPGIPVSTTDAPHKAGSQKRGLRYLTIHDDLRGQFQELRVDITEQLFVLPLVISRDILYGRKNISG